MGRSMTQFGARRESDTITNPITFLGERYGEETVKRTAQCHCGALRAIASGEPDTVGVCHCRACQRRTGAVVPSSAFFLKNKVQFEGASKVYTREAAEGRKVHFHFCPNCGSNVYWDGDLRPGHYGIAVGAFADPDFPAPSYSVWEESMHHWLRQPTDLKRYRQGRTP